MFDFLKGKWVGFLVVVLLNTWFFIGKEINLLCVSWFGLLGGFSAGPISNIIKMGMPKYKSDVEDETDTFEGSYKCLTGHDLDDLDEDPYRVKYLEFCEKYADIIDKYKEYMRVGSLFYVDVPEQTMNPSWRHGWGLAPFRYTMNLAVSIKDEYGVRGQQILIITPDSEFIAEGFTKENIMKLMQIEIDEHEQKLKEQREEVLSRLDSNDE